MNIYIMRHGDAKLLASDDAVRPLSERGVLQAQQMGEWFASQLKRPLDCVLVSPYLRAQQTWQAFAPYVQSSNQVLTEAGLTPYGHSEQVIDYLRARIELENLSQVLLVSHLPLVNYLVSELLNEPSSLPFTTGAMAKIELNDKLERASLCWLQAPERLH
ncbi:MAG: phosphohistidine phosphatase SixA [Vibrionaceae bacterium]